MTTQLDERRAAELRASLSAVGATVDAELRSRITTIHSNQAALTAQQNDLSKQTAKVSKDANQWQKMADSSRGKLKEIGDIQNWAEMIESELLVLEETMRIAEGDGRDTRDANGNAHGVNGTSTHTK